MEIKAVEYIKSQTVGDQFLVTFEDNTQSNVPLTPENRHYQEIALWYDKQKTKPFKYKFKKLLDKRKET